jgi:hypothetical protein
MGVLTMFSALPPIQVKTLNLLSKQNQKLGKGIASWSISSGVSCPGKTQACSACYADAMENQGPHAAAIKKGWAKRYQMTFDLDALESSLSKDLAKLAPGTPVRIHVSGDFHNSEYVMFWRSIAQRFPDLAFFGYTRSWRVPSLMPALEALHARPNVTLFASMDEYCTLPPNGWRYAMMGTLNGHPAPGTILCPELTKKVSDCGSCKLCFNKLAKLSVTFPIH